MKQRLILLLTAFLGISAAALAQTRVSGTVVDAQGEPVVGAAVYVEDQGIVPRRVGRLRKIEVEARGLFPVRIDVADHLPAGRVFRNLDAPERAVDLPAEHPYAHAGDHRRGRRQNKNGAADFSESLSHLLSPCKRTAVRRHFSRTFFSK